VCNVPTTDVDKSRRSKTFIGVCLCVCVSVYRYVSVHTIEYKMAETTITKLAIGIDHHDSWVLAIHLILGQKVTVMVTKCKNIFQTIEWSAWVCIVSRWTPYLRDSRRRWVMRLDLYISTVKYVDDFVWFQGTARVPWLSFAKSLPLYALAVAHFTCTCGYYTLLTCLPQYFKYILHFDIKSVSVENYKVCWQRCSHSHM